MTNSFLISRMLLLLISTLLIGGCASLLHQTSRSSIEAPDTWQSSPGITEQPFTEFENSLSKLFNDPQLNQLIEQGLQNNPDLQTFSYQLKASGLIHQQSIGSRLPRLDLSLTKNKNKSILGISQSYDFGLGVNWEIDLWGRLADLSEAAKSDFLAEQYNFQHAKNQLVVMLIRQWNQVAAARQLLELEQSNRNQLETLLTVQKEKFQYGAITIEDLSQTQVNLANSYADIDSLFQQLKLQESQLCLLVGQQRVEQKLMPLTLTQVAIPPISIPATVLANRPDVNSGFLKLESLDHKTRAAYKALLPSLRLEGNLFRSEGKTSALSQSPNLWSFVGGITQPIFYGGRLKAEAEIEALTAEAQWWQYKKIVLNAIAEVENTLIVEHSLSRQLKQLKEALNQAQQVLSISEQKYRDGAIDILDLVFVRQQAISAEARLIQAIAAQMDNRMLLALALGLGTQAS